MIGSRHRNRPYKSKTCCDRTRGGSFKLKERSFRLDDRRYIIFFNEGGGMFFREVVNAPSLQTFRVRLF